MTTAASEIYADDDVLYKPNIFSVPICFDKNICHFEN